MTSSTKQKTVLRVTSDIRVKILDGTYPANMPLSQEEIAKALEVSRTPVREALQILSSEGLVNIPSSGRASVTAVSPDEVLEKLELRALIEAKLVELAIPVMSSETIEKARVVAEKLESCTPKEWTDLNYQFHEVLYRPANRPIMQKMIKELYYYHHGRLELLLMRRRNVPRSLREHNELLSCCEARDIEGAAHMIETHIMMGGYSLVEHLRALENRELLESQ